MVTSSKFLQDTIKFIKSALSSVTDPISGKRVGDEKFIMTSYPQRKVNYPIITITDDDISTEEKFGMNIEHHIIRIQIEIRVWARNTKERDSIYDDVMNVLRTKQYPLTSAGTSLFEQLFDAELPVAISNLTESGDGGIKSKLIFVAYKFEIGA